MPKGKGYPQAKSLTEVYDNAERLDPAIGQQMTEAGKRDARADLAKHYQAGHLSKADYTALLKRLDAL